MMITCQHGSGQRKRSRLQDEHNLFVKEGLSQKESQAKKTQINATIQLLHSQVKQVFSKGERGKTFANKVTIQEALRILGLDVFQLLASVINLQEEKTALQYQVIQLQTQGITQRTTATGSPAANSYLQPVMLKTTASNIAIGKKLPLPEIPQSLKHSPFKKVLIF